MRRRGRRRTNARAARRWRRQAAGSQAGRRSRTRRSNRARAYAAFRFRPAGAGLHDRCPGSTACGYGMQSTPGPNPSCRRTRPRRASRRSCLQYGTAYAECLRARGRAPLLFLVDRDLLADLLERAADQARDVHLRDAHLLGDLRLGQALEEPQVQDLPLPLVEHPEAGRQHRAVLGDLVLVLLGPERLERVELALLVLARAGGERERAVGAPALERLEHLLDRKST